jgi:hypothetical protein
VASLGPLGGVEELPSVVGGAADASDASPAAGDELHAERSNRHGANASAREENGTIRL